VHNSVPYQPLVSIITIVYNGVHHLEQTIRSVLDQSYPNIEYIVIDGGSKDGSVELIKKYAEKLAYWISEPDKGVSDAFNKGIKQAKGELIGLINADDWYEPDTVQQVVNNIGDADVAYGDMTYWKEGRKDMTVVGSHEFLHNEMALNHPTVFIRSEIYHRFGLFSSDYRFAMDYDLLLRLKTQGLTFKRIPKVLANMRWEGISDRYWKKACLEALAIKNKYLPGNKLLHQLYYNKQVTSIKLGRMLERMHLKGTVRFYRKWLSPVKKRYD
jgi:glycosyltransferase involved in cell wall biosynthesis